MTRVCTIPGCAAAELHARGLCTPHYQAAYRRFRVQGEPMPGESQDEFVNPLVCICAEPQADLHWNAGMCRVCKRKPLALMKAAS